MSGRPSSEVSERRWTALGYAGIAGLIAWFVVAWDRCGERSCVDQTLDSVVRVMGAGIAVLLLGAAAVTIHSAREDAQTNRVLQVLGGIVLGIWVVLVVYAGLARSD